MRDSSARWGVVLEAPDGAELARFYRDLLDWEVRHDDDGDVWVSPPGGSAGAIRCRTAADYRRPDWPPPADGGRPPMSLDIEVADLDAAVAHARSVGAVLADDQPRRSIRVMLDPVGHPFCFFLDAAHT